MRERHWLVSNTRLREGRAPPPASGAGAEGSRVTLLALGHQKKKTHSFDLILHSKNNRGWFCMSCDTWTSTTTVCHWSQGVFTQQWVSVAPRSVGKASIHHFYFALAKKHRPSGLGGTFSEGSFNIPVSPRGKINSSVISDRNLLSCFQRLTVAEPPQPPYLVFQHITVLTIKLNLPCCNASLVMCSCPVPVILCFIYMVEENLVTVIFFPTSR